MLAWSHSLGVVDHLLLLRRQCKDEGFLEKIESEKSEGCNLWGAIEVPPRHSDHSNRFLLADVIIGFLLLLLD